MCKRNQRRNSLKHREVAWRNRQHSAIFPLCTSCRNLKYQQHCKAHFQSAFWVSNNFGTLETICKPWNYIPLDQSVRQVMICTVQQRQRGTGVCSRVPMLSKRDCRKPQGHPYMHLQGFSFAELPTHEAIPSVYVCQLQPTNSMQHYADQIHVSWLRANGRLTCIYKVQYQCMSALNQHCDGVSSTAGLRNSLPVTPRNTYQKISLMGTIPQT